MKFSNALRWAGFLAVGMLPLTITAAGCSSDGQGSDGASVDDDLAVTSDSPVASGSPRTCATEPRPGCPCSVEGQHLYCPRVVVVLGTGKAAQKSCGPGASTCFEGVWTDCIINFSLPPSSQVPPGFWAEPYLGP